MSGWCDPDLAALRALVLYGRVVQRTDRDLGLLNPEGVPAVAAAALPRRPDSPALLSLAMTTAADSGFDIRDGLERWASELSDPLSVDELDVSIDLSLYWLSAIAAGVTDTDLLIRAIRYYGFGSISDRLVRRALRQRAALDRVARRRIRDVLRAWDDLNSLQVQSGEAGVAVQADAARPLAVTVVEGLRAAGVLEECPAGPTVMAPMLDV